LDAKCLKPAQNARIANRGGTLTEAGYISGLKSRVGWTLHRTLVNDHIRDGCKEELEEL
jgi:hypothetical protein